MWLLLPFVVVPVIEIALFVQMGALIGFWPTMGLVLLSAVAGSWLMRRQGRAALAELQRAFRTLDDPTAPLAHGALILLAGALMVTPGFFTDSLGIALLIPAVRRAVIRRMGARMRVTRSGFGFPPGADPARPSPGRAARSGSVIDADYVIVGEGAPPSPEGPLADGPADGPTAGAGADRRPRSGWSRH